MKNRENWSPSKYVMRKDRLRASRDPSEVSVGSRLVADIVASYYDLYIPQYIRGRLADLGCGKVPLYNAYKNYMSDVICVDWENTRHKNPFVDYECDLSQELPFHDGEFDSVILSDVLEHIPTPDYLVKEIGRVLRRGGKVLLNIPYYYCLHETPYDYYRYTEYALRRFADNAGLTIVVLESIGGTPEILADIFAKHMQFVPVLGGSVAAFIQWFTDGFVHTGIGRNLSKRTGKAFPFGYFLVAEKN